MIMPGRLAEGSVPWWQIVVAVAVTLVAAFVFVRVGTRLYERTLLRTGGKLSYRQALTVSDA
jgi:ABC-2 type transport system permease protein